MKRKLLYHAMWIRNIFTRTYFVNVPNRNLCHIKLVGLVKTQTLLKLKVAVRNDQAPLWIRSVHNSCCSLKYNVPRKVYHQTVWNNFNETKKHALYSTVSSQRKIPKEVLLLFLLGITGGVVYGLNKRYEQNKFDRNMDEINKIIIKAEALCVQEKQNEATKLYKDVLQMVKAQIDSEQSQHRMSALTTKFVFIIDQLANLMHGLGKLTDAEDYYKQTLQALLAHGTKQDDDSIIEISLKLASIYAEQKRHELAENGYTWCVKNARRKVNESEKLNINSAALLGISLESFGKYILSRNQFSKAISLFSEALKISRSIFEDDHPQVVLLLNNLGVAYFEAGDMDTSKTYIIKAINLSKDKDHEDLWSFHLNLANVLAQTGDIEEARKQYKQSMQFCHSEEIRHHIEEKLLKLP